MGAKTGYVLSALPWITAIITAFLDPAVLQSVKDAYAANPGTVGFISAAVVVLTVVGNVVLHRTTSPKDSETLGK